MCLVKPERPIALTATNQRISLLVFLLTAKIEIPKKQSIEIYQIVCFIL